ncbi:MAG TPA: hemolysin III family protein [Jatrophihabitans sp.]
MKREFVDLEPLTDDVDRVDFGSDTNRMALVVELPAPVVPRRNVPMLVQDSLLDAAGYTYDADRKLLSHKPLLRGWLHLLWFEISLVAGTLLIVWAAPDRRLVTIVYVASVSGLFGTSALYHRGNWRPRTHRLLQRTDHAMIFLLIAGTETPIFIVTMPGPPGRIMLATVWTLTGIALLLHLSWMSAPEVVVGSTFVALGCLGFAALPGIWMHAGVGAFALVLSGGLCYLVGAVCYHRRRPDPRPNVFGFHEVFHSFVCVAAALQYAALAFAIL